MSWLARYAHHLVLLPVVFFTYAMVGADPLAAGVIAVGGVGMWLHMHGHTHAEYSKSEPRRSNTGNKPWRNRFSQRGHPGVLIGTSDKRLQTLDEARERKEANG